MTAPIATTPIHCPRCGQVLAASDGRALFIGAALIERLVTLQCAAARCGGRVVWRPFVPAVGGPYLTPA